MDVDDNVMDSEPTMGAAGASPPRLNANQPSLGSAPTLEVVGVGPSRINADQPSLGSAPTLEVAGVGPSRVNADQPSLGSDPTILGGADQLGLGQIDQYVLVHKLGGGGFGVVYLAHDTVSGINVALKTLHPLLKSNPEEMKALRTKFSLVSRLSHPNIATALVLHPVRNVSIADDKVRRELCLSPGDSVMVMRYAPGETLSEWRREFPNGVVPLGLALQVVRQIASALDYAHGEKIVHRDIKPANVMVETLLTEAPQTLKEEVRSTKAEGDDGLLTNQLPTGQLATGECASPCIHVRILDFGLAAEIRSSMSRVSTETGDTSGTRPYMAPEQWLGQRQDGRTDQYALACVLYEMLSGAPPFAGVFETGDPIIMRMAVVNDAAGEINGVPAFVNTALQKALAKNLKERFPSCMAFVESCLAPSDRKVLIAEKHGSQGTAEINASPLSTRAPDASSPRLRRRRAWFWGPTLVAATLAVVVVVHEKRRGTVPLASKNRIPHALEMRETPPTFSNAYVAVGVADATKDRGDSEIAVTETNTFILETVQALPEAELLRRKGLAAYAVGDYPTATNCWARWRDTDPGNPEAWAFLGSAFTRLQDISRALEAYRVALRLNPGQVELMLERARLLETSGKIEEAGQLISTYVDTFPDDTKIAVAQANWLERRGKRSAGREILSKLISRHGNDINSRLALHSLLDTPEERYQNMHELLKIGNGGPSRLLGFGHDIASSEILTMPESSVFFDFIREAATTSSSEAVRTLYSDFLPLSTPTTERFDASGLSANWEVRGTNPVTIAGAKNLQTDMAEAFLRKSELLRDGFIEVHLGESVDAFWLYARCSTYAMIRFGFNDDGHIRIQSWKNGEIRTGNSSSWIRPLGDIILRLEIRGDGAMGYVDGRPMFTAPLMIPRDIAYGGWGMAPYTFDHGGACAHIGLAAAGPLSPGLLIMREVESEKVANALDGLRNKMRHLSAISPVLFEQAPDGTVLMTPLADFMPFRMFCSYHRLRLMPAVSLNSYSDVNAETLIKIIQERHLVGLVLLVRVMPDEAWFEKTTKLLETTSANLVVIQREPPIFSDKPVTPEQNLVTVREIQRGSLIFQPSELSWQLPLQDYDTWTPGTKLPSATPQIVVIGGHD